MVRVAARARSGSGVKHPPTLMKRALVVVCAVWAAIAQAQDASLVARARAYEHGEGVAKDPLAAAQLYCAAARDGDADAHFSLGWMYANGRGVTRDDAIAATLFALAAGKGHVQAEAARKLVTTGTWKLPECMELPAIAQKLPMTNAAVDLDPFVDLAPWKQGIAKVVNDLAPKYAVEPRLALAVIAVESNFEKTARSGKDARGLMQLMPSTMARFNVRDGFDVKDNVRGGLAYLRFLLSYYRGQVRLAAAAYNAGEHAVDRYRGIPPYAETVDYVARVLALFGRETHAYDAQARVISPIFAPR